VKNVDRLIRRLRQIPLEARRGIGAELTRAVVAIDARAKKEIQGGGRAGRTYRRRSVTHQASAPAEYPKTNTGQLVGSLFFRVSASNLMAVFGTALNYGRYLEFGTSRMRPRPWLRRSYRAERTNFVGRVDAAIREAIKKASRGG
jgi:HK97 gp10 family phage protein